MTEKDAQDLILWLWFVSMSLAALFPAALLGAVINRLLGKARQRRQPKGFIYRPMAKIRRLPR